MLDLHLFLVFTSNISVRPMEINASKGQWIRCIINDGKHRHFQLSFVRFLFEIEIRIRTAAAAALSLTSESLKMAFNGPFYQIFFSIDFKNIHSYSQTHALLFSMFFFSLFSSLFLLVWKTICFKLNKRIFVFFFFSSSWMKRFSCSFYFCLVYILCWWFCGAMYKKMESNEREKATKENSELWVTAWSVR